MGRVEKASYQANYFCPFLIHSRQNALCFCVKSGLNPAIEHSGCCLNTVFAGGAKKTNKNPKPETTEM